MSQDDDKTWAELVDSFHSSPSSPDGEARWPAAEDLDPDDEYGDGYGSASVTLGTISPDERLPAARRSGDSEGARSENATSGDTTNEGTANGDTDDHFVPPVPTPIPRGDRVSRLAWAGVVSGPAGLILMATFSWTPPDEVLMFLVGAFIAGFVTLISRLRGHHPNDPDNGAVL